MVALKLPLYVLCLCHMVYHLLTGEMPLAMVEEHVAMLTRTLAPQRRRYIAPKRIPRPTQPTGNQETTVANEALQIEKSQKETVPDGE